MSKHFHHAEQSILNICGCGRLHFTYGPVTLHFDRDEFLAFAGEMSRLAGLVRTTIEGQDSIPMPSRNRPACH